VASFTEQLRQNLATLQNWLTAWVEELIHKNRPMWLDDGTPIGRGNVINYSGTVTKVGEQINLSGGSSAAAHDIEGASHTATGLTAGDVLLAESATEFGFGPITDAMLPATITRDTELVAHTEAADPHPQYVLEGDPMAYVPLSVIDAKGDLIVGTADNTATRKPIGADDTVLTADSAEITGTKWAKPRFVTYLVFGTEEQTYTV